MTSTYTVCAAAVTMLLAGACGGEAADSRAASTPTPSTSPSTSTSTSQSPTQSSSSVASETMSASPTTSGFVELPDRTLAYDCTDLSRSQSGGPTVVLLTGLDNQMDVWDQTRDGLPDLPVCAYDRANLGRSDVVDGPRPIHDSVEELHEFFESAEVPPPYLLAGHSYGGLIAMLYAAEHPYNVHSLLLVDGLLPFEDELDDLVNTPKQLRAVRRDLNDNLEELTIFGRLPNAQALTRSLPPVPTVYLFGRLQDLTEPGWPPGAYLTRLRDFMDSLPRGKIVEVEATHGIPVEAPQAIARAVIALRDQR